MFLLAYVIFDIYLQLELILVSEIDKERNKEK